AAAIAAPDLAMPILRWLEWLKVERRSSPHTVAAYRRDLWAFLQFIGRHCGALPSLETLRALRRADLRAYLVDRSKRGLAPSSTAGALAVVRGFFRFLARQERFNNPAIQQARNPKVPHCVPKALSEAEAIDAIGSVGSVSRVAWLPDYRPWIAKRDAAIL